MTRCRGFTLTTRSSLDEVLGVSRDIIPSLFQVSNKPVQSVVSFFCHVRVESCRYLLSFDAGVSDSPVVPVDQINLIENIGDRTQLGVLDKLRGRCSSHRPCGESHVANLNWLAQFSHEAHCPKQSPGGFVPP